MILSQEHPRPPHECPDCARRFETAQSLAQHRHAKHGAPKPAKIQCPDCGAEVSPNGLWMHQRMTKCGEKNDG